MIAGGATPTKSFNMSSIGQNIRWPHNRLTTISASTLIVSLSIALLASVVGKVSAAEVNADWQRLVAAAKKEGKIVLGAPPGTDFRNDVQAALKKRFDLDSEWIQAPGPSVMSKVVAEKQAGSVSVDAFLVGPCTGNSLLKSDVFEPLGTAMILPEVKDPAKWFGGHLWADNQTAKNLLYSFVAQVSARHPTATADNVIAVFGGNDDVLVLIGNHL